MARDVIDHGAVGLDAVLIQLGLGHFRSLDQVHDERVLFGGDPVGFVALAVGGLVLAVVCRAFGATVLPVGCWHSRWWRRCRGRLGLRRR